MKKRAIIYILIGTLLLILGLIFVFDDIISIAVLFIGAAGALIFPGFLMLSSNDEDEKRSKKILSQKPSASTGTLGFLLACIDLTVTAIDEALEKKSKHAYKKNTSRLDYSIYWFFKSYYIICSAQNEALAEAFSSYFPVRRYAGNYLLRHSIRPLRIQTQTTFQPEDDGFHVCMRHITGTSHLRRISDLRQIAPRSIKPTEAKAPVGFSFISPRISLTT